MKLDINIERYANAMLAIAHTILIATMGLFLAVCLGESYRLYLSTYDSATQSFIVIGIGFLLLIWVMYGKPNTKR